MKAREKWGLLLGALPAAVFGVAAILGGVLLLDGIGKIVVIICGVLFLALACFPLYLWYLARGEKLNFFLYNREEKREITVEELTFEQVDENYTMWFQCDVKSGPNSFFQHTFFGDGPPAMISLRLPYWFLLVLRYMEMWEQKEPETYDKFICLDKEIIDGVCAALDVVGMDDAARKLQYYRAAWPNKRDEGRAYLLEHRPDYEEQFLAYIKAHIQDY